MAENAELNQNNDLLDDAEDAVGEEEEGFDAGEVEGEEGSEHDVAEGILN